MQAVEDHVGELAGEVFEAQFAAGAVPACERIQARDHDPGEHFGVGVGSQRTVGLTLGEQAHPEVGELAQRHRQALARLRGRFVEAADVGDREVALGDDAVDVGDDGLGQAVGTSGLGTQRLQCGVDRRAGVVDADAQHLFDDRVFRIEVVVEAAGLHLRRSSDVRQGGGGVAAAREQARGGIEDPHAAALALADPAAIAVPVVVAVGVVIAVAGRFAGFRGNGRQIGCIGAAHAAEKPSPEQAFMQWSAAARCVRGSRVPPQQAHLHSAMNLGSCRGARQREPG